MKKTSKSVIAAAAAITLCCMIMAVVDAVISPPYFVKSAVKLLLFLAVPLLLARFVPELRLGENLRPSRRGFAVAAALGVGVFAIIIGGYFALRGVFDFGGITKSLTDNIGVGKDSFVFVALYISFVNSLLEEFFFRGFSYLSLRRITGGKFAFVFSSLAFALYHVAMMVGWMTAAPTVLIIIGLCVGGMIFNLLDLKFGNIYVSWLTHMFANFAINTIGFMLFGII